jgi:predicted regulator of Ras-like GTPase activity (Roadblock/LC7/MglB family)
VVCLTTSDVPKKLLLMGLGASGKSSIRSVAFEGRSPEEVKDYKATINYTRSMKTVIRSPFEIFDCGGQESFISVFIGEQAELIFNNVAVLVWVIDLSDFDQVSTSQFYFKNAISKLNMYSPNAIIYCLFHKMDLVLQDTRAKIIETLVDFFRPPEEMQIHYRGTSIFEKSIYTVTAEIVQTLIIKSSEAKTISEVLQKFIESSEELAGIALYTEEGLPVFEEGDLADSILIPANLWLSNLDRIQDEFSTSKTYKTYLETDDLIFVCERLKSEIILTGIAKKVAPLQYILIKMEEVAKALKDLV